MMPQHRIGRFDPHRPRLARLDRNPRRRLVDEFFEVGIEVDQRRQRLGHAVDPLRDQRDPVDRRNDDRRHRENGDRQEHQHAQQRRQLRRHAAPLEPFQHRHQRDGDDQRRGHRQEEFRAGPKCERQRDEQANAAHQGQRGQQPDALDLERLHVMGMRIAGAPCARPLRHLNQHLAPARWRMCAKGPQRCGRATSDGLAMLVPPVRLERTLLAELDFESSASTNSATGARERPLAGRKRGARPGLVRRLFTGALLEGLVWRLGGEPQLVGAVVTIAARFTQLENTGQHRLGDHVRLVPGPHLQTYGIDVSLDCSRGNTDLPSDLLCGQPPGNDFKNFLFARRERKLRPVVKPRHSCPVLSTRGQWGAALCPSPQAT